jgi:hypothetical protein
VESGDDLGFRVASADRAGGRHGRFHPRSDLVGGPVRDWQLAAHIERLETRLLGVMLQKFSDENLECCQFADECRRNADKADDLSRKEFWLDMEKRWLHLARSPAFLKQISNFNAAALPARRAAPRQELYERALYPSISTTAPASRACLQTYARLRAEAAAAPPLSSSAVCALYAGSEGLLAGAISSVPAGIGARAPLRSRFSGHDLPGTAFRLHRSHRRDGDRDRAGAAPAMAVRADRALPSALLVPPALLARADEVIE